MRAHRIQLYIVAIVALAALLVPLTPQTQAQNGNGAQREWVFIPFNTAPVTLQDSSGINQLVTGPLTFPLGSTVYAGGAPGGSPAGLIVFASNLQALVGPNSSAQRDGANSIHTQGIGAFISPPPGQNLSNLYGDLVPGEYADRFAPFGGTQAANPQINGLASLIVNLRGSGIPPRNNLGIATIWNEDGSTTIHSNLPVKLGDGQTLPPWTNVTFDKDGTYDYQDLKVADDMSITSTLAIKPVFEPWAASAIEPADGGRSGTWISCSNSQKTCNQLASSKKSDDEKKSVDGQSTPGVFNQTVSPGGTSPTGPTTPTLPVVSLTGSSINEGSTGQTRSLTFTVTMTISSTSNVNVTLTHIGGTATVGVDFSGPLNFNGVINPGQTVKGFTTDTVLGDSVPEPNETVIRRITQATGATINTLQGTATSTIINDD